jgi:hypothetical protein
VPSFEEVDINNDGVISREEYEALVTKTSPLPRQPPSLASLPAGLLPQTAPSAAATSRQRAVRYE